jgi:hypothetical protein
MLEFGHSAVPISIAGATRAASVEKNWMPLLLRGKLHLVYNLDPLVVLKCGALFDTGACEI